MNVVRPANIILSAMVLGGGQLWAQTAATNAPASTNSTPPSIENKEEKSWNLGLSVYGFIVPNSQDYVQPTITADHGFLHLEARYNYENLKTGSVWAGANFGGGEKLAWTITPMLGGVFGNTAGVAPGYSGSLSWWKLELYSEGEYVFDTRDSSGNFFYNWAELSLAPVEWFRFGMVTQRTRVYRTDRDIQRGVLVGFTIKKVSFTVYVFNPDESKPTVALAGSLNF